MDQWGVIDGHWASHHDWFGLIHQPFFWLDPEVNRKLQNDPCCERETTKKSTQERWKSGDFFVWGEPLTTWIFRPASPSNFIWRVSFCSLLSTLELSRWSPGEPIFDCQMAPPTQRQCSLPGSPGNLGMMFKACSEKP